MHYKSIGWFLSDGQHCLLMGYKRKDRKDKRKSLPKLPKRKNRKRKKKIIVMRLQTGTTTTRTKIIRIKRKFIFLATAWLKN